MPFLAAPQRQIIICLTNSFSNELFASLLRAGSSNVPKSSSLSPTRDTATHISTTPQNSEMNPSKLAHDHLFLTTSSTMLAGFSCNLHSCISALPGFHLHKFQQRRAPEQPPVAFQPATLVSPTFFEPSSLSFGDPDCLDIDNPISKF
jgi:hypothetical protein